MSYQIRLEHFAEIVSSGRDGPFSDWSPGYALPAYFAPGDGLPRRQWEMLRILIKYNNINNNFLTT
jgi:hypothetical protein